MNKHVPFDDEVTKVARIVFPKEDIRSAKLIVREAARYAEQCGILTIQRQRHPGKSKPLLSVAHSDFREWAASKWPELRRHFKLPIIGSIDATLPKIQSTANLIQIPTDHDELVRQFVTATDALMNCQNELAECKKRLEHLEKEASDRKKNDELTTQRRQAAGKSGGRGNWNV